MSGTEIVPADELTEAEARLLVTRINATVANLVELVDRLYAGRGWVALGYATWDEMCASEVVVPKLGRAERADVVLELRGAGMSTRAIGSALGVGDATVRRDLSTASDDAVDALPDAVVGLDGRRWPAVQPPRSAPALGVSVPEPVPIPGQEMAYWWQEIRDRDLLRKYLTRLGLSAAEEEAWLAEVDRRQHAERLHAADLRVAGRLRSAMQGWDELIRFRNHVRRDEVLALLSTTDQETLASIEAALAVLVPALADAIAGQVQP